MNRKSGFTLIELMITLAILAATASLVMLSTTEDARETLHDETFRRGCVTQAAVAEFVKDMGRYPIVHPGKEPLAELHDTSLIFDADSAKSMERRESTLTTQDVFSDVLPANAPSVINMMTGWDGPYLTDRRVDEDGAIKRVTPSLDGYGGAWRTDDLPDVLQFEDYVNVFCVTPLT